MLNHIADDWDRKLCISYLEEYMQADLVDGELMLAPSFPAPPVRTISFKNSFLIQISNEKFFKLYVMDKLFTEYRLYWLSQLH